MLTLSGYREAGGVRGAIAQTAERALTALPEADQAIARSIFLSLTARLSALALRPATSRRRRDPVAKRPARTRELHRRSPPTSTAAPSTETARYARSLPHLAWRRPRRSVSERAARESRNPATGETIQIATNRAAKFTAAAALKRQLNSCRVKHAR